MRSEGRRIVSCARGRTKEGEVGASAQLLGASRTGVKQTHLGLEVVEAGVAHGVLGHLVALEPEVDDGVLLGELAQAEPALEAAVAEVEDLEALCAVGLAPRAKVGRERRQGRVVVEAELVQVGEGRQVGERGRREAVVRCRDLLKRGERRERRGEGGEGVVRDDCGR